MKLLIIGKNSPMITSNSCIFYTVMVQQVCICGIFDTLQLISQASPNTLYTVQSYSIKMLHISLCCKLTH